MEDVLDLYAQPPDPARPVVCFYEAPLQLIGETRDKVPARPGRLARVDYEYRGMGTPNLFVAVDNQRGWREVWVTDRRASRDFAHRMRDLVDHHYPDATTIRVVMDNLSTHSPGALYETFPPHEARRLLRRLEFHFAPKHASWLNMVEIKIGVLRGQCLDRRIAERETLESEVSAWQDTRNADRARIKWMFDTDGARQKLGQAYPTPIKES